MSFAVLATSKRLADAGVEHIITASGNIIVEAYDPNAMVKDLISVKKEGKTWVIKRSPKKMIKARDYYRKLMAAKRATGQYKPKKTGKKFPKRAAAIKKAHKNPKLFKRDAAPAGGGKKVAKKVVKPVSKKVAPKAAPKKVAKPAAKKTVKIVKKGAKKKSMV